MKTCGEGFAELIDSLTERVIRTHLSVRITCSRGRTVLVGEEDWCEMRRTLQLIRHFAPGIEEYVKNRARDPGNTFVPEGIEWLDEPDEP